MSASWPQDWASRGDATTRVSTNPRKAMSLDFRSIIEGSRYERKVEYVSASTRPDSGEYLGMHVHTESYPSGGSVQYAKFAYWNGEKWERDSEWVHSGPRSYDDPSIQWFAIKSL